MAQSLICRIQDLEAQIADLLNAVDNDVQQLGVDCEAGTLTLTDGGEVDLASLGSTTRQVWQVDPTVANGFTYESWTGETASGEGASTQAGFEAAWAGAPVSGVPTHVNGAPNVTGVETDTRFAQGELGQDEHRLCYWVHNDSAVAITLQDTDTRAESLHIYAGCDCPGALVEERYQTEDGSPWHSKGIPFLTLPPGGMTKLTVLIHDPGADYSGFNLFAATVDDPETLFVPTSYQDRPATVCRDETWLNCEESYALVEGESFKPVDLSCLDCGGGGGGVDESDVVALLPVASTLIPVADNEDDVSLRTGVIGTSTDYARADHNHPVRLQTFPDDPVPVVSLAATEIAVVRLDRWRDEESIQYEFRVQTSQVAGIGWGIITVPVMAGFQQPIITGIGTYRNGSTTPQLDEPGGQGGDGAAPRGPYMGCEAHHWSSTARVYLGFYRRDADIPNQYTTFNVRYIRS